MTTDTYKIVLTDKMYVDDRRDFLFQIGMNVDTTGIGLPYYTDKALLSSEHFRFISDCNIGTVQLVENAKIFNGSFGSICTDKLLCTSICSVRAYFQSLPYATQLEAIRDWGYHIELVDKQTPEMCKIAVQSSPSAIRYIKRQTPELCLIAVQGDGRVLQYIRDPTLKVIETAVRNDGKALEDVPFDKQTLELCILAVAQTPKADKYVRYDLRDAVHQKLYGCSFYGDY